MKKLSYLIIALLCLQACNKDSSSNSLSNGSNSASGGTGQGGSLARFTIAQDYLYVVDNKQLYAYSLASSERPVLKSSVNIGFNIETIYSYGDKLFVGSQNAMYIYSIINPAQPDRLGEASHVRACDPVVANDSMAYVTVRGGSSCGGTRNSLLVYDVRQILNPRLLNTINLEGPWGLGLKGDRLYVCDGAAGLKVFSLANAANPELISVVTGETFFDVIPTTDVLVAMVEGGTALYSYKPGGLVNFAAKMQN